MMANAQKLYHMIDDEDQFEDWVQAKITMAEDYVNAAYSYLTYYNGEGEADESDWDDDTEGWDEEGDYEMDDNGDWDDVEEEDWDSEDIDDGDSGYNDALDAEIDDDMFESKQR